jgi:acyl carrier protein
MRHGRDTVTGEAEDIARLVAILTRVAGPDRTPDRVGPETPINEGGFWLDSADLLEVVLACEVAFSVDLDPSAFFADGSALTVTRLMDAVHGARRR